MKNLSLLTLMAIALLCVAGCKDEDDNCVPVDWRAMATGSFISGSIVGDTAVLYYGFSGAATDICSRHAVVPLWFVEIGPGEYIAGDQVAGIIKWTGLDGTTDSLLVQLQSTVLNNKMGYAATGDTLDLSDAFHSGNASVTTKIRFKLRGSQGSTVEQRRTWVESHFPEMYGEVYYTACNHCDAVH